MKRTRSYSPHTLEAAQMLGAQIRLARLERRWSERELADRVDVSPATLRKIEHGSPTVGLGVAFEAATLVGVPLFHADRRQLSGELDRARDRAALLPQRVRTPRAEVKDDF